MRQRFMGGALLAAAAVFVGADTVRAQTPADAEPPVYQLPITVRGQMPSSPANTGFDAPLNSEPTIPIPTGKTGDAGFYATAEFVYLTQTRTVGNQIIAFRGIVDSTGAITGLPGTYVGSGQVGLTTRDLGRSTFAPGVSTELGYKFEDGSRIYFSYLHMFDSDYSAGATLAAPFARSRRDLTDTFLTSGVFNFSPKYAGPGQKTAFDLPGAPASNTYGIWNGASEMTITLVQRFQTGEIGGRVPVYQTDYSRVYGLAGGRYAWFYERFAWRTVSFASDGTSLPSDAATYSNRLSQHLYGPFIGCGHEVFLANQFSLSLDLTAALLLGTVSERAKYELGDLSTQAKRGVNEWTVVPNANANLNLWWYPIEGVQVRLGYQAMTFFNTRSMSEPVGFNVGAIDPRYDVQYFRLIHGLNVGV
ncbi:MAG: hypothetical protein JWO38_5729, partial [Gemmataceae bacterium]|nr:hypothetical protein [Gemmataceae bacterium]